ncbi:PfkB family carbohydrate kinase, partial [Streptomyces sp. NPDC059556]|uniref:PfkB family carbohydrate kinase n=1 Tax=Streptomyces sp. NPDC059556 TaxID=3346863 RepID=UPI00368704B7
PPAQTAPARASRPHPAGTGPTLPVAPARAGGVVSLLGAGGADDFGARLRATLEHCSVDTDLLRTAEGASGTAHIVVDDEGGNAIVVVPGANGTVTSLDHGDEALIGTADALLLQLELPLSVVVEGAATARRLGVRTVLTPAPAQPLPPELLATIDLLVPNEHEAAALTGLSDPREAALALLRDVPEVVVTLGAAGSLYAVRGADPVTVPAPRVRAVDTTAAGDTFVGALVVALGEGRPAPEALAWAGAAAALSVQHEGASTSMPYRSEIEAAYGSLGETEDRGGKETDPA